jgi:hypothetical protein
MNIVIYYLLEFFLFENKNKNKVFTIFSINNRK